MLLVWYHCEGVSPTWAVPEQREITTKEWVFRGQTEHFVDAHIQVGSPVPPWGTSTPGSQNLRITESQNGRGWKGPLWITQSNPLPKQGHPEQAAQDLVQAGLEHLQRK